MALGWWKKPRPERWRALRSRAHRAAQGTAKPYPAPLIQRCPPVTETSAGDVTFTMRLSWTAARACSRRRSGVDRVDQVFAILKIEDFKNFLRLHIARDGSLALYRVKIEHAPRRWRERKPHTRPRSRFPSEVCSGRLTDYDHEA